MKLHEATAAACVDAWAAGRLPAWTDRERDALRTTLLDLSEATTPHVVEDAAIGGQDAQKFLLRRAVAAIEDALVRAAAGMRRALRAAPVVRASDGSPALGLRSARIEDLDALPGIGRERAGDLARALAWHTGMDRFERLDAVEGIGPAVLETLRARTYFDTPGSALTSPTLSAFCHAPTIANALALFDRTDLEVSHGEACPAQPLLDTAPAARLSRLLERVRDDARARRSPLSGTFASQGLKVLARDALRARYLGASQPSGGELLIDAAYRDAMIRAISDATDSLDIAVFLATDSRHRVQGIGSRDIVEVISAKLAAGVVVRMVVDRDRPDDPYHSGVINAPLVARLRAAGANVKYDHRDRLLHSKLLIADRRCVIVGSHNLTTSSIAHTHEVSVRLDAPTVAADFAARFDALWATLP